MSELVTEGEELNMEQSFPLYPSTNRFRYGSASRDLRYIALSRDCATTNTHEGRTGLGGNEWAKHALDDRTDASEKERRQTTKGGRFRKRGRRSPPKSEH